MLAGLGAFTCWGVFPLYFRELGAFSALEIIAHRIVWSLLLVLLIILVTGRFAKVRAAFSNRSVLAIFSASTVLIAINWLTFVWAITNGYVLETSLGYYINPLVNVLLGVLFLGERLNRWQGLAVALALVAVLQMTIQAGSFPWISLMLGFSFGFYGLLRKKAPAESVVGLTVETALLAPISALYLVYLFAAGDLQNGTIAAGGFYEAGDLLLLMGTGLITAIPLILFAVGAQRLRLSTVGLLQYIAPTMQFFLAIYVFDQPFDPATLIAFGLIWTGLVIYSWDGLRRR
nr:EamA family transporter RarD [Sneathiella chinensis]